MNLDSVGTPGLWIGFTVFVLVMLAIDLGVFHRRTHTVSVREALGWTVIWITLSLCFNLLLYHWFGKQKALEFLTGYVLEKALSIDNLFVFLVLFSYFSVPSQLQHRVLYWGILMAIVLRAVFIFAGTAAVQRFHWVMYAFGGFLVLTGLKLLFSSNEEVDPGSNRMLRLFRKFVPMVDDYRGNAFIVVEAGKKMATPLLLVLVTVEATDVVFAIDSIPAIFGVTTDPFIVFTSNIFAILGLRAMFFVLAGMIDKFHYLNYGLGLVLSFIGVKMLVESWLHISVGVSLGVIGFLLAGSVVLSLIFPQKRDADDPQDEPDQPTQPAADA